MKVRGIPGSKTNISKFVVESGDQEVHVWCPPPVKVFEKPVGENTILLSADLVFLPISHSQNVHNGRAVSPKPESAWPLKRLKIWFSS